jgi:hypothetical protein
MKTGRGWWALAGFGVLTLLGLYVGAYFALVTPNGVVFDPAFPNEKVVVPDAYQSAWMGPFFWPINQIDRRLRPHLWTHGWGRP